MCSLIIDTSTKWLYVCLMQDEKELARYQFISEKEHSANCLYTIKTMLRSNDLTVDDISRVYCGFGPGSYTGQRIAVTIAKMFCAFKENMELYKVSSLYLASSGYNNKNVLTMFDARRGNVFCSLRGEKTLEDKLRSKEEVLEYIKGLHDVKIVEEDDFKVDPVKVMEQGERVLDVDSFVPNYLRISEAEYNLLKHD